MQNLKEVLSFAFSLGKAYEAAKADGKIDITDAVLLVEPITKLMPAIDNVQAVKDEIKAMDEAQRADMMTWAKAEFDIADDELEAKIEAGLDMVLHMAQFLGAVGVFAAEQPAQ